MDLPSLTESIRLVLEQWASYPRPGERIVSAIGIDVHWTILQYVMGLPFIALIAQIIYLKSKDEFWLDLSRKLVKGFVIVFAVGAATGTAAEFGLITLWPNFAEAGGKWIYFPFYAEIYAFIMEVIFVYLLYYGWNRVSGRVRLVLTLLVLLGSWYSAAMILAVNSFMVAPTGLEPAYDPGRGYLYEEGYPRIRLLLPLSVSEILDKEALEKIGVSLYEKDSLLWADIPVKLTYRLFWEASRGYKLEESILWGFIRDQYKSSMNNISVASVLDEILGYTLDYYDPLIYPFLSPIWLPSVLHVIGASIVVSSYTLVGAYALRIIVSRRWDRRYLRVLKFSLLIALASLALQGSILGHEQALAVAHYLPEKLAAMEGTTDTILSISRHLTLGVGEKIVSLLAYGSLQAKLPDYDSIPRDYCLTPGISLVECRPPLIIHYLYYAKITLAFLLGAFTLVATVRVYKGWRLGSPTLYMLVITPVVAHAISFLGWFVREAGRKPFTVYGLFTPEEAANPAGPDMAVLMLIGFYLIGILAFLAWAVYRFLWR